jgi:hypothetical protein
MDMTLAEMDVFWEEAKKTIIYILNEAAHENAMLSPTTFVTVVWSSSNQI